MGRCNLNPLFGVYRESFMARSSSFRNASRVARSPITVSSRPRTIPDLQIQFRFRSRSLHQGLSGSVLDLIHAEDHSARGDNMRIFLKGMLSLAVIMAFNAVIAGAAEKTITEHDLPPAVRRTADEQVRGAIVRGYSTDNEDGQMEYEVDMIVNGHSKDVSIAPDGTLIEIEEQVNLRSLSPKVRSGLTARAGRGRITKVESIRKHGTIVAYEAQVKTAGRHSEIQVGPDGQGLAHEE